VIHRLIPGRSFSRKQYRTPNVNVGTVKESMAAIASRWFHASALHRRSYSCAGYSRLCRAPVVHLLRLADLNDCIVPAHGSAYGIALNWNDQIGMGTVVFPPFQPFLGFFHVDGVDFPGSV